MEQHLSQVELATCPGGPTSEEVAAVALQKLGSGETFLDVGCGTGRVSLLAAERFDRVYAVDRREVAVETTRENFDRSGVEATVERGEAPAVLDDLPGPDAAFVGGSRNLAPVLERLRDARLVVSCARMETATGAVTALREADRLEETVVLNVARGYDLRGGTGFRGDNPVYLVVGGRC